MFNTYRDGLETWINYRSSGFPKDNIQENSLRKLLGQTNTRIQ